MFYKTGSEDITVTLSQTDEIGTITKAMEAGEIPTCENPSRGILVDRPAGTYNYKAVSATCYWSGSVTIGSGGCETVKFEDCK